MLKETNLYTLSLIFNDYDLLVLHMYKGLKLNDEWFGFILGLYHLTPTSDVFISFLYVYRGLTLLILCYQELPHADHSQATHLFFQGKSNTSLPLRNSLTLFHPPNKHPFLIYYSLMIPISRSIHNHSIPLIPPYEMFSYTWRSVCTES